MISRFARLTCLVKKRPTQTRLHHLVRRPHSQIDPKVTREMKLANLVKDARARGDSPGEVQALIETFDRRLETA
jgi:hypothetical protein